MSFWAQFLISSVGGGTLSTVAGIVVGFLMRRWLKPILGGQQEIKELARTAADQSTHAAARASGAEEQSKKAAVSADSAHQSAATAGEAANEAKHAALELKASNGRIVALLPDSGDSVEYLKETNSRLVAQLVIQASRHPEDFDSPSAPRFAPPQAETATEEAMTTGRHRLHSAETLRLQTIHEGDPE